MSAPRANKEDKKKRLGSRRFKAKQSEPHEADEINFMGSASVVEEENTESPNVCNPDKSENETQHQPLSERTEKRRKLGSSRINKGRQNVKDPETASSYKAREADEKPTDDEGLETTRVSWETQFEKQEDFSQAREHENSATQSSPLCSVNMSHDSESDYVAHREDVSQMLISRSEKLKANENERTVVSDSDKLEKTVLKETHTTVILSEKVREHTQSTNVSETGLSVCSSTDQELIYQSNLEKISKEEQSEVHSTTDKENTERCEDADAPLLDGNLLITNLMSESHMRVLEACATAKITDQTEALPADEAQCEASSQDSVGEAANAVNGTETFEIAEETLLIQTAVPVKRVETWPATSDTVSLPGIYELNSSHMSPQVNQQRTGPPGVEEMPDECSIIKTESDDTDFLGQQAISQASSSESSASVTREITIERSRSAERVGPECSVEQVAASGKELSANEEQNENFNFTDIMENIYVSSENLKTQAEFEDTQQSELQSFDSGSQEGSNPDKNHESLTKEKIFLPLEHTSKDYDSKKPHTRNPEGRDTELCQVYEAEGQLEESIKSNAEQTSHQQEEGLFYKGEDSKYLQNLESQIQFTLTSQPQENLMSTEEQMTNFNPIGSRRKLGSRRMNKGHQHVRDSAAESHNENEEDNIGHIGHNRSNETTKDTLALQTMKQEETTQETVHDITMSVTDDSSLYSVFMAGDCSQVQNPTTTMRSQASLIVASENLQEANNENEADFEVEALNKSLEELSGGMAIDDSPQSKDHCAREKSVNAQTNEDQEHVDSHVYETKEVQTTDIEEPDDTALFQLTEDDTEPSAAQTGHRGKRELWSPEVHTQPGGSTEQVRLSSPIEELSKSEEQNVNLCEAGGAQPSDDAVPKVNEQDVKQTNKQMHVAQEATENVKPTLQAAFMDTHQSNMDAHTKRPQGRNTGADTALSEESVESQGQAEEAVHTETQDNTFSISEQETTDFTLMGDKRKVGSRRKNKGQQQVKDSDVETATTSETEIQETSLETMLEETDTPQTKDVRDQGEDEDAHSGTGVQSNVTDDQQVMDQSDFTKVHADECPHQASVTHTESNEKDRDTDLLKQRETLQTNSCESGLKPEGSESSVTLDKTTEKSTSEEETGPEGRVEQAALSSPKEEQNESLILSEVTEHTQTAQVQDIDYISVEENRPSVQSHSDVHSPGHSTDVQTHDTTKTGLEALIHESDSFQEEHEKREMCVESVGETLEDMERSDCFGGKEAASSDGSTTKQDDSNFDTNHDNLTEENITKVLDQTNQDHVSDEVNPQPSDAERVRTGSALVNKSESQDEGDIKPPAEQTSHVEEEGTPSPAQDTTSSFQSLQSPIHVSVEPQTQDDSVSVKEQSNKDFKSMGSRRKLGSSRRNQGKGHGKNPESSQRSTAEARNTVGCEQAEASTGPMQDTPQTEDRDTLVDMSEVANISIQSSSTLDQQLIDQSNSMMQIHNEEHSHVSVSDTESSERDKDTICLKVEEVEGRESSVTLEKSREKTYAGEETEHDWPVEQAPLSSSQKEMSTNEEQSERLHECEVTVAHHTDTAAGKVHEEELKTEKTQGMDPADHSGSSAQSHLEVHGPVDSQPELASQDKEESHTGSKSAEHRRKLGSSRRTKGKQHGLDSANETDLKLKEDAGNTWGDEEVSLATDTRQEELKQQTDPRVNASEQLRRNRNEGETTRKIRKEETTLPHNVMEHSVTETTDVTSRSDKDDALHKHTDESENPTKNEQMKGSEAVEMTRSAVSQRTGKEELIEESVDDITLSVTHDGSLYPASSPGHSTDVQTHDTTKTGLEALIRESDSFQEEHEKQEMCVESVGATLEDMERSDCFGGKEAASSDGSTTKQDDSNFDTNHDSLTEENITKVLDQTNQDHVSDEVNPQPSDAERVRTGSALVNKSESQDEGDIRPPAEQTSHVEKEGTPSPAQDTTSSFQSLQSPIHVSVEPQTQDDSVSVKEQSNKDFKSMGSRRKLGSSRRNQGKGHGKNPESSQRSTPEARNTVGCEQAEASTGPMQDTPQTEDRDALVDMSEVANMSIQSSSTLDLQLIDQSNSMMQIHNEEHSYVSVSDTESSERGKDTICLKVEEVEGRESSVTLEKSREKTYAGEETEHDWPVEQAPLSSSQKEMSTNEEQSERLHECEVTVAHHTDTAAGKVHEEELKIEKTQEMDPADHSGSSAQSHLEVHGPVDSQPELASQDKEESHTGSKSAEHRRKLGSSRRTKGKQHGLDSANETDLKLKEDAGNTWGDEEVSLATDTRQEELKQQTDPRVNASEQLRRNRNEGETTRKIRKEETTLPHNVMEHRVTETTDVTSRSDKDDALHKHTDESENPTKNEQMKGSEAVETTRSAVSPRTGKEELSEESVDDITLSVTHDGSLYPASSPGHSTDVQTHDTTKTGLEALIRESDSFQEEHEKQEMCVESVGATLEDMERSDCFGGKEAASSDGSTTKQDDSNFGTNHDSLTEENITKVLDQTNQDHVSDEVNPQPSDAERVRTGSALVNKSESQDEGDIKPPAEQTSHVEKEGTPSPAQDTTSSFQSLQSPIHVSVEPQTQDDSVSVKEQSNKDFKSMGSRRKLGSSRRNQGKGHGKNPESSQRSTAEARNTVGCEQAEASTGPMQDTPQTEDRDALVDMSEVANMSIQSSSTLDLQLIDQSNSMMQIHNEEHSHVSVSDTESSERGKDTICLKVEEVEGRESSVTLEKSREKTYAGEETEHDWPVEQAPLSSSQKEMSTNEEQSERLHECEVTVAHHTDTAAGKVHEEELKTEKTQGMDPADHSGSSAQSHLEVHGPVDSQPELTSQDKEESHTGSKSAEHRRKLGSSRRTKGKQHGLDSANETDLKLKEDAGNTWGDEEVSLATDTRQEELKQQTDPRVNASEQLRRNRNEGETTRKIRKEETTLPHNVMEHRVTETTDVTSRSDKDNALHKHTDESENPTKNEQMKGSEAVETTRSAVSPRTGKEELSEESVDDITMSVTHDGSLYPASSPGHSTDVQTHDTTKTGLEALIHESGSFQEEHEKQEMCVESVGETLEDMERSDCFGGKEAASSDGSTTKQDDSNFDTNHDNLTEENITKVLDQTNQDHVSDEVNPQPSDAERVRTGSALVNKSESQDEGDIRSPAEQTSHVEEEGTPSPAQDSTSSFQSLQSPIHVSVEPQTQDDSVSVKEQSNKDFKSMGSRRKLGSSRRNQGKGHGKNPESSQRSTAEARNTVGCEQAEASAGPMQDTPQTEDRDALVDMSEVANMSIQSSSTLDQQLIDQSNSMMQIHNEEHSYVSVSDTESSERDKDTICLKVEEVEGRESSVTLEKSREKTYAGEETEHDWPVEQAPLSSSQKEMSTNEEQSERLHECEVTVAHHTDTAAGKVHEEELKTEKTQGMDPADHSGSSAQSHLEVHGPVDSQPELTSQDKEESHTGSKSAEHRRKLGSSRRTKGKQHGLDSANETDLKLKEDAGNTWGDEEVSLATDTRQEELKQQTDPRVNASEQLRRNRNEGETTRKIRKEETTLPHNVMEHRVTETTDVTSRSDKDDALHKHTDESENLTLLTGKRDGLEDVEKLMVTTETLQNRRSQPSLSNQLLQPRTETETAQSTTKDEEGPEAMTSADVPGVIVYESNGVNEGAINTNSDIRNASPNFNSPNRRRKMGSTRRNLGSPSKRESLNQKQDIPETARGAGDGLSESASGATWLQPQEQHQHRESEQKEEKEGVERSSISESQFNAAVYQTADRNPDSPSLLEETKPQVDQDYLATKPSASPEQDATPESSNGGRRRKFGSNRKSRGNYEDQTAREDRRIDAPTDGGPTEERTNNGEDGGESVVLHKQEKSDIQIDESDKKLSPNVSSAGESWRPGSEKGKQVAPHVGINPSPKSFSLAADSTEADVRSRGYNVLMVGDTSVGKTSFMKRAQSGKFSLDLPSSVGLDSCMWTVVVDGKRVVLHLWDTAGQERFHSITRQIFHKAQAFLLMYDVTSSKSFSAVSYWANCIQEGAADNVSVLLLGNKSDREERQVKTQDGECLAKEYNFGFMECSAATGQNVIECLETIARTLTQRADTRQEAVALKQEPQPKKRSGCC